MKEDRHPGTLFIVATPIGNLEDITLRALKVLREVDLIAAEDTRKTRKLLSAYDIHKPLISLYDQVEKQKSPVIISHMLGGRDVAYVSEAGTPGISDPGYQLINAAIRESIRVVPVPGPSAVVAALSASGLPMNTFVFSGFLPSQASKRRKHLESLRDETRTVVIYESPQRVMDSLSDMLEILGDRRVVLARELTKIHEEMIRGGLGSVIDQLRSGGGDIRGEITILLAGAEARPPEISDEEIIGKFSELRKNEKLSTRDMISRISRETGLPRNRVYKLISSLD
jgi:16S rRNA (cytidine1402-2'-O)-methyltransferase